MDFKKIKNENKITATKLEHCPRLKSVIKKYSQEKIINNHKVLLEKGEVCTNLYFVIKGAIKQYAHTNHNKNGQINKFYLEDTMASDFNSFLHKTNSESSLLGIKGSILWVLDRTNFNQLIIDIPDFKQKFTQCIIKLDKIRDNDSNYMMLMALYKKLNI